MIESSYYNEEELNNVGFQAVGKNVRISRYAHFYGASFISIADNVRIDDFAILSVGADSYIGQYVHIASHSSIFASKGFTLSDFSGISSRVTIYGDSDDYSGKFLTSPTIPIELRNVNSSRVLVAKFALVGAGTIILPGAHLAEGSAIGAQLLVNKPTEPWKVYFGSPARVISERSQDLLNLVDKIS